jgi:hypothetical protein
MWSRMKVLAVLEYRGPLSLSHSIACGALRLASPNMPVMHYREHSTDD